MGWLREKVLPDGLGPTKFLSLPFAFKEFPILDHASESLQLLPSICNRDDVLTQILLGKLGDHSGLRSHQRPDGIFRHGIINSAACIIFAFCFRS